MKQMIFLILNEILNDYVVEAAYHKELVFRYFYFISEKNKTLL